MLDEKTQLTQIIGKQLGWSSDPKQYGQQARIIWKNPRRKDRGGMLLTEEGYNIFTKHMDIKSYKIDFPEDSKITNQVMVWLDHFIDGPYYIVRTSTSITNPSIIVFKEKTAVHLALFGGDVQKFGLSQAMAQRFE